MATLEQIKASVPWAKGLSDSELIEEIAIATGKPADVVAEKYGRFPKSRNPAAVANDLVIGGANMALGGAKSVADFVVPGNRVSRGIQTVVDEGESSQSYPVQRAKRLLSEGLQTDDIGTQASAVGKYVTDYPGLVAAEALGAFAGPGLAIKGAQGVAKGLGYGKQAITRAGLGAGAVTSGAMSGGDAAGNAYELVMNSAALAHLSEEERDDVATRAARAASVAPAIYGAATGMMGAEAALARGASKGILRTAGSEFLQEAGDEGLSAYSGRKAASMYDESINPMEGVAGQALLGGVMGGVTGGAMGAITREQKPPQVPPTIGDPTQPTDVLGTPEPQQLGLFPDSELEPFTGPRQPPPPGYTPDMFNPDQGIAMPPVEYTAPVGVDPAFAAIQQKQQVAAQRAAQKQGVAPAQQVAQSADPGIQLRAEVTPALEQAGKDIDPKGVSPQKRLALLNRHINQAGATDRASFETLLDEAVRENVAGWEKAELTSPKKGEPTARRGEAQLLLNWQQRLRGEDPISIEDYVKLRDAQKTLDDAKQVEAARENQKKAAALPGGNAAQAPIVGRTLQQAPPVAETAAAPAPKEEFANPTPFPNVEVTPEPPAPITEPVVRRRKKVVTGVKPQTQFTEMGEKVNREAPEIGEDVPVVEQPAVAEDATSIDEVGEDVTSEVMSDTEQETDREVRTADDREGKGESYQAGTAMSVRDQRKGERGGNATSASPKAIAAAMQVFEKHEKNLSARKQGDSGKEGGFAVDDDTLSIAAEQELAKGDKSDAKRMERITVEVDRRAQILFAKLRKADPNAGILTVESEPKEAPTQELTGALPDKVLEEETGVAPTEEAATEEEPAVEVVEPAPAEKPAPKQKSLALKDVPQWFLRDHEVEYRAYNDATNEYVKHSMPAEAALDGINQDIDTFRALLKCVKGS